uniref:Secreted protein n=1 Tax=Mus musculus TaxID=10090 RepID=Q3UFB6_MOUSE|nr:unnamed protein product [Mus musculus]
MAIISVSGFIAFSACAHAVESIKVLQIDTPEMLTLCFKPCKTIQVTDTLFPLQILKSGLWTPVLSPPQRDCYMNES